jgi:hypothetical protein
MARKHEPLEVVDSSGLTDDDWPDDEPAGKPVPLHHCFIEGQKKSPADAGLVVRREHG